MIAIGPDVRTAAVKRRPGRVGVVVGMLLMPLAAIVLGTAALLQADGWTGSGSRACRGTDACGRCRSGVDTGARRACGVTPPADGSVDIADRCAETRGVTDAGRGGSSPRSGASGRPVRPPARCRTSSLVSACRAAARSTSRRLTIPTGRLSSMIGTAVIPASSISATTSARSSAGCIAAGSVVMTASTAGSV